MLIAQAFVKSISDSDMSNTLTSDLDLGERLINSKMNSNQFIEETTDN